MRTQPKEKKIKRRKRQIYKNGGNCNRTDFPGGEDISPPKEEGLHPQKGHKSPGRTWAGVVWIQT